jgi:hypothetical protein
MDEVPGMLASDRGVVLSLFVHRRRKLEEQRKPWNRGQLTAARWKSEGKIEKYFARSGGPTCDGYPAGGRRFFSPVWEIARTTPPEILPTFLGLHVLQDVPPEFALFTTN